MEHIVNLFKPFVNQNSNYLQKLQTQMNKKRSLPQVLRQPLKVSKFVQLYLLKREHPFKFHFLDMLNNEFVTQIGSQINCTCIPGYFDHCIHSFYVMQKIFKLKEDDPLIWQNKYSVKDLEMLLESEKGLKAKNKEILITLKSMNLQFEVELNHSMIKLDTKQKSPQKREKSLSVIETNKRPDQIQLYTQLLQQTKQLQQKEQELLFGGQQLLSCPICHQTITYETPVFQCKVKCKNYYHIKCLKFWVKHQRKSMIEYDRVDESTFEHRSSIKVTCPMCRNYFPENIDTLLISGENQFKKYYQSQGITCDQCKQEIFLKIYHCLLCPNINICDSCYKGWKHQKHDRFLMKSNKRSQWEVPPGRSPFSMTKLQFSLQYIKNLSKTSKQTKSEGQIKQLFGQNYSKFMESNLSKPDILEYLKQTFINIEKEIHKTYKPVDFNQETLKCSVCKNSSIVGMKRMFCKDKHFIDEKCLTFFLKNNFFQCPRDKSFILEGLQGIKIDIKELLKKPTKKPK